MFDILYCPKNNFNSFLKNLPSLGINFVVRKRQIKCSILPFKTQLFILKANVLSRKYNNSFPIKITIVKENTKHLA